MQDFHPLLIFLPVFVFSPLRRKDPVLSAIYKKVFAFELHHFRFDEYRSVIAQTWAKLCEYHG